MAIRESCDHTLEPGACWGRSLSDLLGKTMRSAERFFDRYGQECILFTGLDGTQYNLGSPLHRKDGLESGSVWVEDCEGDLNDLVGSPILRAEESTNEFDSPPPGQFRTFYRFETAKGSVVLRFFDRFYSNRVDFLTYAPRTTLDKKGNK